ncbi:response regulator transcription factor [Paenibacillus glycinis]|uniref:Response regulator n=1 Tax=Paenibacillus glycinis TaxID=2697035 RepID=A0ABW9XZZ3_9BACL|nr:response regulator [Paenibacillus glycinis]NBD28041.1 response regulator [Paenibacillus glycinis]
MFNIMIVDDEYYFRQALKVSLPWEAMGFRIAGEAKNGEEALEVLSGLDPDVVLVDINMPIMDGIAFIQNAKQTKPELKFVILTGHSEFAIAKQAVQLGVTNYVLKPVNEEELRTTLLDLKTAMQKERFERLQLENLESQVKAYKPVLKDKWLNELLQGSGPMDPSSVKKDLEKLDIDLKAPYFVVVAVDMDATDRNDSDEERQVRTLAMQSIAQAYLQDAYPDVCFHHHNNRLVMIIGSPNGSYDPVEPLCHAILQSVRRTMSCTVTIGIGNGHSGAQSISRSHKEALFALKQRFVSGGNQVFVHSKIAESGMKGSLFTVEKRSGLLMCMRIGNNSEAEEWLAAFFRDVRARNASMAMLLVAGLEIISTCMEFLAEASQSVEHVFRNATELDMLQFIQQMGTLSELESWVRTLILDVMARVHDGKPNRSVKIIEDVKTYIGHHYGNEELRIEEIAKSVHLNYNHLCSVFKKATSVTINDYLTELRITKAKELFDHGEKVIQVVANHVGYADANYFSKCFKKHTGITPSRYLNK